MLVAIISDIHDNIPALQTCLNWCANNNIKKIICCGDICNLETLKYLSNNFAGEIFLVDGNGELYTADEAKSFTNIVYEGEIGFQILDNLIIGFCHQEKDFDKVLKKTGNHPDFLFYGHSHKPWLENKNGIFICNPGNISGTFYGSTFATLDTKIKKLELKIINNLS